MARQLHSQLLGKFCCHDPVKVVPVIPWEVENTASLGQYFKISLTPDLPTSLLLVWISAV